MWRWLNWNWRYTVEGMKWSNSATVQGWMQLENKENARKEPTNLMEKREDDFKTRV